MSQHNDSKNPNEGQKPPHKPIEIKKIITAKPLTNKFSFVLKSDPYLGDSIQSINVDLCFKEIDFIAAESNDYKWLDWILYLRPDESISLFFLDSQGRNRYMLLLDNISIINHDMLVVNPNHQNNFESTHRIRHKISIQYQNIQKVCLDGSQPVRYKPIKKRKQRSN